VPALARRSGTHRVSPATSCNVRAMLGDLSEVADGPDDPPDFLLTIRGYDRVQVDDYIAGVLRELHELRHQPPPAPVAATDPTDAPLAAAGERIGELFERAIAEAEGVRQQAADDAAAALG